MKKFTYFFVGIPLITICGGALAGTVELHEAVSTYVQRLSSFPESGSLIVLGSVLIVGASFLRRRRAARSR
ncbi:MAG TPA: PEP-CTERM sorting domain-containing protein [Candidatus Angelobacter sp.]|nr:PEP-CTERM sorting domain-containing protein [Candidatus Angelobacter sp.]